LSKLDEAMRKHIEYVVLKEERPFSFHDFLNFQLDGLEYHMSSGTFRNKVSALVKEGQVEVAYYSSVAFYTIKGVKFANTMTPGHRVRCHYHQSAPLKNYDTSKTIQSIGSSKTYHLTKARYMTYDSGLL
jgi:hypothetical protein